MTPDYLVFPRILQLCVLSEVLALTRRSIVRTHFHRCRHSRSQSFRMIWSKGIDLAVAAVGLCRNRGYDVTLSLCGAPDTSNPRAISEEQLQAWGDFEGVAWLGPTRDVRTIWAAHHVACLPSRGGEGLPRTLLEAAACGRAIVTTDVSGCRTLVRTGIDGLVVPPDDRKPWRTPLRYLLPIR